MRKSLEKIIGKIRKTSSIAKTSALTALLAVFLSAKAEDMRNNNTNFYNPPAPTNLWMRCYGNCEFDVDDEIIFYNTRIVPCGWTKITSPREYSCFIYGDDPYTKGEDGARQNDPLYAWVYDKSEGKEYFATISGDEARFSVDEKKNLNIEKAKLGIARNEKGYVLNWPSLGIREMTYDIDYTDELSGEWKLAIDGLKENSWTDDGSTTSGLSKQRFYRVVAY